jgi:putative tryptophan/tyrosine transport system substrate-binding protein
MADSGAREQSAMPVVGYLNVGVAALRRDHTAAFRRGLSELGFVEGRNIAIEYRWAEGQPDRLPTLAADLVRRQVSLIVAPGGDLTALAAKAATADMDRIANSTQLRRE